jgi:hypothetical protein
MQFRILLPGLECKLDAAAKIPTPEINGHSAHPRKQKQSMGPLELASNDTHAIEPEKLDAIAIQSMGSILQRSSTVGV